MSERPIPPWARIGFVAVFVIFGGAGVLLAFTEWSILLGDLFHPYHFGDPPNPAALACSGVGVVLTLIILARFLRTGRASLPLAGVVLACAVGCWIWAAVAEPRGRSWATPDREIVNAAAALREKMATQLEGKGEIPTDLPAWSAALEASVTWASPVSDRRFHNVPYAIARVDAPKAQPAQLVPGTLLVWVSNDRAQFEITPIGFGKEGSPAALWDQSGDPLVLRGAFNPDAEH